MKNSIYWLALSFSLLTSPFLKASERANWEAVYAQSLQSSPKQSIALLYDRYRALPSGYEKLYISSKIHSFMTLKGQPYYGQTSPFDADYSKKEIDFISALNNEENLNFEAAQQTYSAMLNHALQTNDMDGQLLLEYHLCRTLNRYGEYHKANVYCSSLNSNLSRTANPVFPTYRGLRVVGNNYEFTGQYKQALATYELLLEQLPSYEDASGVYNDIGNLLRVLGQYDQSLNYLEQGLKLREELNIPLKLAQIYNSLGATYLSMHRYEDSIVYMNRAYSILKQRNHWYGLTHVKVGIGKAHIALKEYDLGISYLLSALNNETETDNLSVRGDVYLTLARTYQGRGLYIAALDYANSASELAIQIGDYDLLAESQKVKSSVWEGEENYQQALNSYKEYANTELDKRNTKHKQALEALNLARAEYQEQREQAKLVSANAEQAARLSSLHQQRIFYNLIVLFLIVIVLVFFYSKRKVQKKADQDSLTGILNRAASIRSIKSQLGYKNTAIKHVLILLDLDEFKKINDAYGHPTGDIALKHVTNAIKGFLSERDIIGRLGGEEFIVLLRDIDELEVRERVEEIHHAIRAQPFETENHVEQTVTASFAFLSTSKPLDDYDELYSILDQALYQAKQNGRNCIVDALNDPISLSPQSYDLNQP